MSKLHDPGGKISLPLLAGMQGGAKFIGKRQQYRVLLWRAWGKRRRKFILWIGMNPSTARADFDDPTVRREIRWSMTWGYDYYIKMNVLDYRLTKSGDLTKVRRPCSRRNINRIIRRAKRADCVILAYGNLPNAMQKYPRQLLRKLRQRRIKAYCLGINKNGSPKHPLYLPNSAHRQPYPAR